jgi:ectoine hydroxylase-related dioxygenase (phytanoyl-CoA dioxygenase family)
VLTDEQLAAFGRDGYLVVPDVVPEALLAAADAEVDAVVAADAPPAGHIGPHFVFLPPSRLPAADATLRASPALAVAGELVAPLPLDHALDHIQVALVVPPHPHRPGGPHIDGHRPDQDRPTSFTLLAGIALGDESRPDSGNLWVWPGSHELHRRLFAERGTRALLPVSGHATMLDPPPPPAGPILRALGPPVPVTLRRGDLLLAHHLLVHNSGGNTTTRVRRMLYHRLACPDHADSWEQTYLDPLTEYAPVRASLARATRGRGAAARTAS